MMTDSSKTTENVIGKAIEVHRELGSGLLESGDEACFVYELVEPGLSFFPTWNCPALPSACCRTSMSQRCDAEQVVLQTIRMRICLRVLCALRGKRLL